MIKDHITGITYSGRNCPLCGSEDISVMHTVNPKFPDDMLKDLIDIRCEKCKYTIYKAEGFERFTTVEEAISAWNKGVTADDSN